MERWASALALGEMKNEHALPVLVQLLDDFLPPQINPLELEGGIYLFWHIKIATLLGNWERGELAPALQHAPRIIAIPCPFISKIMQHKTVIYQESLR